MVAWNASRLRAVRRSLDLAAFWRSLPPVARAPRGAPLGLTPYASPASPAEWLAQYAATH